MCTVGDLSTSERIKMLSDIIWIYIKIKIWLGINLYTVFFLQFSYPV